MVFLSNGVNIWAEIGLVISNCSGTACQLSTKAVYHSLDRYLCRLLWGWRLIVYDFLGYGQGVIELVIFSGIKFFYIIFFKFLFAFFLLQDICRLIVGNCCFYIGRIISDDIIPMNMNFSGVDFGGSPIPAGNAVVGVEYFDVAISEIICVTIDETVINAWPGKIFDSISGMDVCLHSVFGDKKMISAAHNGMVGIIEQVIRIEY